jgi:putative endonuclease
MYYVYFLQSLKNGHYYIGSSSNPFDRLAEHNSGKTKSTKLLRPWKLVFHQKYSTPEEARRIEKKLKNFKNRKIIDQIILDNQIKAE